MKSIRKTTPTTVIPAFHASFRTCEAGEESSSFDTGRRSLASARDDDFVEPDRLAAAKMFADELNDSRLWKIKISYQKRWTKHRRALKSLEIQMTKPWLRATGPKTAAGKRRASGNWAGGLDMLDLEFRSLMSEYARFLSCVVRARKIGHPELLAECHMWGRAINLRLRWMGVCFHLDYAGYFHVTQRNNQ